MMIGTHETQDGILLEIECSPWFGEILSATDSETGEPVAIPAMEQDDINAIAQELWAERE